MPLLACNDKGASTSSDDTSSGDDTATPGGVDADSDGYEGVESGGDDCDDGDASVNPGAAEACNGVDDDCDGDVDEEVSFATWYADSDGDGYGDPEVSAEASAQPSETVSDGTDCDDTQAGTHPGAEEIWYDGIDEDCEGGDDYDADADSYDSIDQGGGDCDDDDPSISPGEAETCEDGVDNDCDEEIDAAPCSMSLADADARLIGPEVWGLAAWSVSGAGDVDEDGFADLLVGAPSDGSHYDAGQAYVVLGPVSGDFDLSLSDAIADGNSLCPASDQTASLSYSVSSAGDMNGDGFPDIVVGAPWHEPVFVLAGPLSGVIESADKAWRLVGPTSSWVGMSVASAGDVDGDGLPDLVLCASVMVSER